MMYKIYNKNYNLRGEIMLNINNEITRRKTKWKKFLGSDPDIQFLYLINIEEDEIERPLPWPDNKQERIDWALKRYNYQLDKINWLSDDSLPYLSVYTGTEIFAEAFGCKVHRPENEMPFALPLITNPDQVAKLNVPEIESTRLSMLFEIADELSQSVEEDALIKLPDIQSPMDIAALIWEKKSFYMAIIDNPEAVKELADKVKKLLIDFLDQWFARYGSEFIAHYPSYYMPEGITLSEDEVGVVNDKMFKEFFLPELNELSKRYGGIGIHCCANAEHQWDIFEKIDNLKLLNLVQPPETLKRAYNFFKDIPQMHSWTGEGAPWTWPEQLPARCHAVMEITVKTRKEAKNVSSKLRNLQNEVI